MKSLSYTPRAGFSEDWGSFILMLILVRSFSYTRRASFSEEFLLHS